MRCINAIKAIVPAQAGPAKPQKEMSTEKLDLTVQAVNDGVAALPGQHPSGKTE